MVMKRQKVNLLNRFLPKKKDSTKLYIEALEALLEGDVENAILKLKDLVQYDTNNISCLLYTSPSPRDS